MTVLVFASTKAVEFHIAALYFPHYMTFIYLFLLFVQMKVVLFFEVVKWEELEDRWEFRGDVGGRKSIWLRMTNCLWFHVTNFTLNLN